MSIRTQVTCLDIWPIYPDMKAYNSWNTEVHKIKHGQVHSKSIKDSKTISWLNTMLRRPTNHINLLIHSNKAHPHTLVTTYVPGKMQSMKPDLSDCHDAWQVVLRAVERRVSPQRDKAS